MASLGHRTDDQSRVQSRSSNCDQTKVDDRNEDGANAFVLDDSDDGIGSLDNNRPNNTNDVLLMNDIGRPFQQSPHEKDFMSELELSIQQIPRSKFFRNLVCKFKLDSVGQQKVLGKIEQRLRERAYEFRKENNNPNASDINVGIGKSKRPRATSECSDVIRSPDNNNRNEYLERNDIRSNRRMNRGGKKFPQKLMDVITRLGHWGHPYSHQVYVDFSSRRCPSYFHNLPATLGSVRIVPEEQVQNLYKKK